MIDTTLRQTTSACARGLRSGAAVLFCVLAAVSGAAAQDAGTAPAQEVEVRQDGFRLRKVTIGSGYSSVELPPLTLGGFLPQDALNADLISMTAFNLGWNRNRMNSNVALSLDGIYTNRVKYSEISAAGGSFLIGASRTLAGKFRISATGSSGIFNSDQAMFAPTVNEQLIESQETFDNLSRTVALPRSRHPNPAAAAWFVPITQSALVSGEAYGQRLQTSGASVGFSYSKSRRFMLNVDAGYSSARSIDSSNEPGAVLLFPTMEAQSYSAGGTYTLSRRTEIGGGVSHSRSVGSFAQDNTAVGMSYGWTGRKWFYRVSSGVAFRQVPPVAPADYLVNTATEGLTPLPLSNKPLATYNFNVGYMTGAQTFLVGHGRAPNDSQGYGSLAGPTLSVEGLWSWAPLRSKWMTRANFSVFRVPGNFLYIHTWLANVLVSRSITEHLRVTGELIYDRHGSKGFEGFHLTRQGFQVSLEWVPFKRLF